MADFTQTVTDSMNLFGGGPSTKWATNAAGTYTMTWGTSKWGEGTEDVLQAVTNLITNTQTLSEPVLAFDTIKVIDDSITGTSDSPDQSLLSGGYYYVFPSNQTDADNQFSPTYTSASVGSVTWTSAAVGSSSWS